MTDSSNQPNALAERTLSRLQGDLREHNTACAAQVVELIREITARPDHVSVQHLAELIERDVAVVAEVLRIANTIGFNPEGVEIITVAQAIQVIGFLKIRNLAVSLLLLQNAGRLTNPRESREASALAVACGYLAEAGLARLGVGDPGHAFVCAALRRYGQLLLTTFLTEEHRQAVALARTMPEEAAFVQVFGLGPLELGRRLLEGMGLADGILRTFRELPDAAERRQMEAETAQVLVVTDFAVQVTGWLMTGGGGGTIEAMVPVLRERYGDSMVLQSADLKEILAEVDHRLGVLRGSIGSLPVLDRVRALVSGPAGARRAGLSAGTAAARGVETTRILLDGIGEVSDLLGMQPMKGPKVFLAGARSVEAALGLVDCWVFRRPAGEAVLRPFVGSGPLFPQLPVRSMIDPVVRTVFTVCLDRGEIVLLSRPADPKIQPFVPEWLMQVTGEMPLVLLPVGSAKCVSAVLCGVGDSGALQELSPAVRQQLQVLARLLALARDA